MLIRFRAEQQWAVDHGVLQSHLVRLHVTVVLVVVDFGLFVSNSALPLGCSGPYHGECM